jgi:hypothetical protein
MVPTGKKMPERTEKNMCTPSRAGEEKMDDGSNTTKGREVGT